MPRARFRPRGFTGALDAHLPRIRAVLVKKLWRAQKDFARETLKLKKAALAELSSIVVGLAEDLHCELGLWHALEKAQRGFYGTPLPFIVQPDGGLAPGAIAPERIQHLLWVVYPLLKPGLVLTPDHVDLVYLSTVAARVLEDQFAGLSQDSGLREFLRARSEHAGEIKRKLIWLGTQSYLCRVFYDRFAQKQSPKSSVISVIDDFVCQQCTEWSGLGPLEILAGALDLPANRRAELLAWSERHAAPFKVLSGGRRVLRLRNLVSDAVYRVGMDVEQKAFAPGQIVLGSLVPWDGAWAWSGEQRVYAELPPKAISDLTEGYRRMPQVPYRYCKDDLKRVQGVVRTHYEAFVARHGRAWTVYPNGLALAAGLQQDSRRTFEALSIEKRQEWMEAHGLQQPPPKMNIAPDLLEDESGIGAFFNPEQGMEIMPNFNVLLSGLTHRGVNLGPAEANAIANWVYAETVSPAFVRALAEEHGPESIKAAFLLDECSEPYSLEYLLRRYKGQFYRTRYPAVTLVR
jgi:hypothetical protein